MGEGSRLMGLEAFVLLTYRSVDWGRQIRAETLFWCG